MHSRTLGLVGLVLTVTTSSVLGQIQTFINDFDGWMTATGAFSIIDFETLPDGSPSASSTEINALLNYTNQGATFSSPLDDLIIAGNRTTGFTLRTSEFGTIENPAYLRADLVRFC